MLIILIWLEMLYEININSLIHVCMLFSTNKKVFNEIDLFGKNLRLIK